MTKTEEYRNEQKEEVLKLLKDIFKKDVVCNAKRWDYTLSADGFEVVKVEFDEQTGLFDALINVEIDVDADDFDFDTYNDEPKFNASNIVNSAQDGLYRFLVNSGKLSYYEDRLSKRNKNYGYQIWCIKNTVYGICIYHTIPRFGGPDYFTVDDELLDQVINDADPTVITATEDEFEANVDSIKVPIWITIKFVC